jgi:hypothetical protein
MQELANELKLHSYTKIGFKISAAIFTKLGLVKSVKMDESHLAFID